MGRNCPPEPRYRASFAGTVIAIFSVRDERQPLADSRTPASATRYGVGKYVSDEQVTAYEQYLFVPVDRNEADAETLMQIPDVDEDTG